MKKTIGIVVTIALLGGVFWYFNQGAERPGRPGRPGGFGPVLVVAEPVTRQPLIKSVEAIGTARAIESVTLTASIADKVRRVNFEDGDYVESGTVLVEQTNQEEEAQLAEARANLREARRQLTRLEDLDQRGIVATSEVDQARSLAEAAEARLNTIVARLDDRLIRAPFNGLLGFREVSPGTLVKPGDAISTIDDISTINLDFTVPETVLGLMQPGRKIYARSAAWADRTFEGQVRAVGSRVDPVTRAVVVRAAIDNEDRALRPGMLLTVKVVTEEREALLVPERSIVQLGNDTYVYVVGPEQRAQQQTVVLGHRQAGTVEITAGLQEGDQIITEGVIKMRNGVQVRFAGDESETRVARPGPGPDQQSGRPTDAPARGGPPGAAAEEDS